MIAMKVFIVEEGYYSDRGVVGVFSNSEKAQAFIVEHVRRGKDEDDFGVSEWDVDEEILSPIAGWIIHMDKDGNVLEKGAYDRVFPENSGFDRFCLTEGFTFGKPNLEYFVYYVDVEDYVRAVKIVNEKRIAILVQNLWGDRERVKQLKI